MISRCQKPRGGEGVRGEKEKEEGMGERELVCVYRFFVKDWPDRWKAETEK